MDRKRYKRKRAVRTISRAAYMRIIEGLQQSETFPDDIMPYFKEALRQGKAG